MVTVESAEREYNLQNLLHEVEGGYTVVVGERRPRDVTKPCDCLLPLSWGDIVGLGRLPQVSSCQIIPDTAIVDHAWKPGTLIIPSWFQGPALSIAGPDANFLSLMLNSSALFRFAIDDTAHSAFFNAFRKKSAGQHEEMGDIVRRLCPQAIWDPFVNDTDRLHRHELPRFPYGLVSLASHPGGDFGFTVLAAGITGPMTAAAVALLSGKRIKETGGVGWSGLNTRPLGGVFRRSDHANASRPFDVLNIDKEVEWVTPPYSVADLQARLLFVKSQIKPGDPVTIEDIGRMQELIATVQRGDNAPDRMLKFKVVLMVGGRGTRMAKIMKAKDVSSKCELPLPPYDDFTTPSVAGYILSGLKATTMLAEAILLTSNLHIGAHVDLAQRLQNELQIPIRVKNDGGNGDTRSLTALKELIALTPPNVAYTLVMMGDTLFTTRDIKNIVCQIAHLGGAAGLVVSDSGVADTRNYGVVELDSSGGIAHLLEKVGQGTTPFVSQGIYALSNLVNWGSMIDGSCATNMVDLINHAIRHCRFRVIPIFLNDKPLDCGSETGYNSAEEWLKQYGSNIITCSEEEPTCSEK